MAHSHFQQLILLLTKPLQKMKPRNFLFSKTKYLQKDITEVSVQKGSGIGGGYWVLNRGLCIYKSINLAGIAKKDRGAALAIRLQQLSPFAHPGHFIAFHEDTAQIWLWDASAQKRAALDLRFVDAWRTGRVQYGEKARAAPLISTDFPLLTRITDTDK